MNSIQFFESILDWLLADPAHIVVAASLVAALTPTPDPNSWAGKLYRIVDLIALNVLRAKDTGSAPVQNPAPGQTKSTQAGFSRLTAAIVAAAMGALLMLAGCSGVQSVAMTANAQAVQAATIAGKDELALGKEILCGLPFQVAENAMADDAALATALPALCPAMKSAPATVVPTGTAKHQGPADLTGQSAG